LQGQSFDTNIACILKHGKGGVDIFSIGVQDLCQLIGKGKKQASGDSQEWFGERVPYTSSVNSFTHHEKFEKQLHIYRN